MERHFLQSPAWAKFEKAEGREVFERKGDGFSYLAVKHETPLGNYLYCPYGPTVENAGAMKAALDSLTELAQEQKAFFVRVEPTIVMS